MASFTACSTQLISARPTPGTSGVTNGQVVGVVDELSGVEQAFSYGTTGVSKGQIIGTYEENGSDNYSVGYAYNSAGERTTSTYITPQGTTKWGYYDYTVIGGGRAFQTINKLGGSGNRTGEEFHYEYDTDGRLLQAAFAQSPQSGQSEYSSLYPAASRARAWYVYDSAGRLLHLEHYWDAWNSGSYSAAVKVLANSCDYETTGLNRGLKTNSRFYEKDTSSNNWSMDREEVFGYDPSRDYLTNTDYGDGLSNEEVSWAYDAAGNRTYDSSNTGTWSYDNLNRMTASPGFGYTNDLAGNRLEKGSSIDYGWDVLNRMTSYTDSSGTTDYAYRADGLRVLKDGVSLTRYRYDGQTGFENDESASSSVTVTRFGIGARGIDYIAKTNSSGTVESHPIYDAHGNQIAALGKSGSSFQLADCLSIGVWGELRAGNSTSNRGHVAALSHTMESESSLMYMRARYYERETGRFISSDPGRYGTNWFVYCDNNPISFIDRSGENPWFEAIKWLFVEVVVGTILPFIPDQHPILKCLIQVVDGATKGISAFKVIAGLGAVGDSKVRAAFIGLAEIFMVAQFALATYQAAVAGMLLACEDEEKYGSLYDMYEVQAGFSYKPGWGLD